MPKTPAENVELLHLPVRNFMPSTDSRTTASNQVMEG